MMTIGLIALDLDGTLLDSQKNLSERNRRALERCARMGIQIVPTQAGQWMVSRRKYGLCRESTMPYPPTAEQ